ncbi:MAG: tetratricopeptide repeat protein, partial [Patescibacteria group bacterium]
PDFESPGLEYTEDGEEIYFEAGKPDENLFMSVHIGPKKRGEGAIGCRNFYKMQMFMNKDYREVNIRDWQYKDITITEHEIRNFENTGKMLKNYFGCVVQDDKWISILISKLGYMRGDRGYFIDILKSVKLLEGPPEEYVEFMVNRVLAMDSRSAELENFLGLYYYERGDYKNAKKYYRKAYEKNLESNELDDLMWLDMVNGLGVSYALTKDYENATEIFEYGITGSPEFGLFYYNLACVYAETGNKDKALENLRVALKYKVNQNNGHVLDSPLADPSFASLMDDEDFLELARQFK